MRLTITVAGSDVTGLNLIDGTEITRDSSAGVSTARVRFIQSSRKTLQATHALFDEVLFNEVLFDETDYFNPPNWSSIVITDETGARQFAGYITQIERRLSSTNDVMLDCSCSDYGITLNRRYHSGTYLNKSDQFIILSAFAGFNEVIVEPENIAKLADSLGQFEVKDQNLRQLMDRICEITGGEWKIDYDRKLHYYQIGASAPWSISGNPDNINSFAVNFGSVREDASAMANRIIVLGALSSGGEEVTATAEDAEAQAKYGVLAHTMVDRQIPDTTAAQLRANAELANRKDVQVNGTFKYWIVPGRQSYPTTPLDVGQLVSISHASAGLSGEYMIRRSTMRWVSADSVECSCDFGSRRITEVTLMRYLLERVQQPYVPDALPPNSSVTNQKIVSIDGGKIQGHATGLESVWASQFGVTGVGDGRTATIQYKKADGSNGTLQFHGGILTSNS